MSIRPPPLLSRQLSDNARQLFVETLSSDEELNKSRFLTKLDKRDVKLQVNWISNRPARDWNAVQPSSTSNNWESVLPPVLEEMAVSHMQRELEREGSKKKVEGRFEIVGTELVLSKNSLQRFRELQYPNSETLPAWGFHSTSSEAIDLIAQHGIYMSGDFLPSTGKILSNAHGSRYGRGVYLTPNLGLTKLYNEGEDELGVSQTLLCMIQFGKVRHLKYPCIICEIDFNTQSDLDFHSQWDCKYALFANVKNSSHRPKKVLEVFDFKEFDSLVSPDQFQWIIRKNPTERVLPVIIVNYTWRNADAKPFRPFSWKSKEDMKKEQVDNEEDNNAPGFFPLALIVNQEDKYKRTEKTYWGLHFKPSSILPRRTGEKKSPSIRITLIIERCLPEKMVKNILSPSLNQFLNSLKYSSCNIISFAGGGEKEIEFKRNVTSGYLQSTAFLESMKIGGNGTVSSTMTEACLKGLSETIKQTEDRARNSLFMHADKATQELFTPDPVPFFSSRQNINQYSRNLVLACANQAVKIVEKDLKDKTIEGILKTQEDEIIPQTLNVFLLLFSKNDALNEEKKKDKELLDKISKYARNTNSICKLICFGTLSSIPKAEFSLQTSLTTMAHYERKIIYQVDTPKEIPIRLDELKQDLDLILKNFCTIGRIKVELPSHVKYGDGFITSADLPPVRQVQILLHDEEEEEEEEIVLLFSTSLETPPPKYLLFNSYHSVYFDLNRQQFPSLLSCKALSNISMSARIAACQGRSVKQFLRLSKSIIEHALNESSFNIRLLNEGIQNEKRQKEILKWMREKKLLMSSITELRESLNDIETALLVFSVNNNNISASTVPSWITKPLEWKFGKRALKRARETVEKDEEIIIEELKQEIIQFNNKTSSFPQKSIIEFLYTIPLPCSGIRCCIARSEAAIVDPFLIRVEFVSGEFIADSRETICELDLSIVRKDSYWKSRTPDAILITGEDSPKMIMTMIRRTILFKAFNAVMFTKNPLLQVADQHLALLFASYCRSCEQLMKWRDLVSPKAIPPFSQQVVIPFIETARALFNTIRSICSSGRNNRVSHIMKGFQLEEHELASWLPKSETTGVSSVTEALAVYCCGMSTHSFSSKLIPITLLAEAISRQIKVVVKKNQEVARKMIRNALGITLDSCPTENDSPPIPSNQINIQIGYPFTAKFFSFPCPTNCSAWSVVATLGLSELFWDDTLSNDDVFRSFQREVSMNSFLIRNFPKETPPKILQIALFVQGLVSYKSNERATRVGPLLDSLIHKPKELLQAFAQTERMSVYKDRLNQARLKLTTQQLARNKQLKMNLLLQEQSNFLDSHSQRPPKLFNHEEIAKLNQFRSKDDQLELDINSFLLKHHCCFEDCPFYLQNFQTDHDKLTGKRNGLYRHLKVLFIPNKFYLNELHLVCKSWLIRPGYSKIKIPKELFLQKLQAFAQERTQDPNLRLVCLNFGDKIYEQWKAIVN